MRLLPRSRAGRVLVAVALALGLFLVATALLFVWPRTDDPTKADAVVALSGNPHRARKAIQLARAGYAPVAAISRDRHQPCPSAPHGVELLCFHADPLTTQGEAEYAARLAARRHWTRLIVVPDRTQATRARMLFKRCTKAQLFIVAVADPPGKFISGVIYEWGALFKALVIKRSC